jgi:hypothetical protein
MPEQGASQHRLFWLQAWPVGTQEGTHFPFMQVPPSSGQQGWVASQLPPARAHNVPQTPQLHGSPEQQEWPSQHGTLPSHLSDIRRQA